MTFTVFYTLGYFPLLNLFCLLLKSDFSSLRVLFTASVDPNIKFPFLNQTMRGTFPYIQYTCTLVIECSTDAESIVCNILPLNSGNSNFR